jgi:Cu+-exporting ATPase
MSDTTLLKLAASLERSSEHPLAAAIVKGAQERGVELSEPQDFNSITGKGVRGVVEGQAVALGNQSLMEEMSIEVGDLLTRAEELRRDGQTVMLVAIDDQPAGLLGVADPIKASTPEAVHLLHQDGLNSSC